MPSVPVAQHTILIVEDDPIMRAQLQDFLEEEGDRFKVHAVPSARQALDLMATTTPDLVILDLTLPDRSGYDVCEHIRGSANTRDVPVLVVSARLLPSHRAAAEEAGASAYMSKPFNKRDLLRQVQELLPQLLSSRDGAASGEGTKR